MNKILTVLTICTLMFAASHAQAQNSLRANSPTASVYADTLDNAATIYMYTPNYNGKQAVVSIWLKATKLSGTGAGTVTLQGSLTGTVANAADWYDVYNTVSDTVYSWTLTNTATQGKRWQLHDAGDSYYRLKIVGSGTESVRVEGKVSVK